MNGDILYKAGRVVACAAVDGRRFSSSLGLGAMSVSSAAWIPGTELLKISKQGTVASPIHKTNDGERIAFILRRGGETKTWTGLPPHQVD